MREAVVQVFTFDELSEEAKDRVIEEYWDINVCFDWWDSVYEDAKTIGCNMIEGFDLDHNDCGLVLVQSAKVVIDL